MKEKKKKNRLTITFPTSRIDAAIPEKQNPKEAEGSGRSAALSPGTVWENLGTNAGKCFEARGARPLITGYRLFEDSLRGNKNREMERNGRRLVDRERTSHHPKRRVSNHFSRQMHEWVTHQSPCGHCFNFWHYFFSTGISPVESEGGKGIRHRELSRRISSQR